MVVIRWYYGYSCDTKLEVRALKVAAIFIGALKRSEQRENRQNQEKEKKTVKRLGESELQRCFSF